VLSLQAHSCLVEGTEVDAGRVLLFSIALDKKLP
jgi:hypothetical protein